MAQETLDPKAAARAQQCHSQPDIHVVGESPCIYLSCERALPFGGGVASACAMKKSKLSGRGSGDLSLAA